MIFKEKNRLNPFFSLGVRLFLNADNFQSGMTFAWNANKSRATKFDTKLEAETFAMQFSAKYPEFLMALKTTWMRVRS